jgi:S-(hydroxymethyl)glutathione dehydrogenase / alcohol dehydrogenase
VRALVLRSVPGGAGLESVDTDRPGPREVLVRTAAAGICHSDLHFLEGTYPTSLPVVMGHEGAGVVESIGSEVTYVRPGDHVVMTPSLFCGECFYCLSGRPAICSKSGGGLQRDPNERPRLAAGGERIGQFAYLSCFAEEMLVNERAVVRVPIELPLDRAALLGCGVTTGLGAVFNTASMPAGATMAVIGLGGIGLAAVQAGAIAGASRIIAIDLVSSKLTMAARFGATDTVNSAEQDPVETVKELTSGEGVDFSFEAVGRAATVRSAFLMLRRGGTATVVGMVPPGDDILLPGPEFLGERRIQGSNMGSNRARVDIPRYGEMYLRGKLNLDDLISARVSLEGVVGSLRALELGETARTVAIL